MGRSREDALSPDVSSAGAARWSSRSWRGRVSALLLVITFLLAIGVGPMVYAGSVIEDQDAFVSVVDEILATAEIRRALAESVTELSFESLSADEAVAQVLPERVRPLAVPLTRLAGEQATELAYRLLETEPVVEVRDSALRELHRQMTSDGDGVEVDLRAVVVKVGRDMGGPAVGAGLAKFVTERDTGRYQLVPPGSASSRAGLLTVVRSIPAVGGSVALATVASLILAVLVAEDRRRALMLGGLALGAAALVSTVVVTVVLYSILDGLSGGSPLGGAVARVISADYARQERGALLSGLVLAAVAMLLGDNRSAVILRHLPADLWHRRSGTADSIAVVVADNPPLARALLWSGGAFVALEWTSPTARVMVSVILLTVGGVATVLLLTGTGPISARTRRTLGIHSPAVARYQGDEGGGLQLRLAALAVSVFLFWPAWGVDVLRAAFVLAALAQVAAEIRPARRIIDSRHPVEATNSQRGRRLWIPVAVGLVLAGVVAVVATTSSVSRTQAATGCNGHIELCDRRVDEVVFAGSHNAMSSEALGWDLALQKGDMVAQLDHGVRALLIDALYWGEQGELDGAATPESKAVVEAALGDDRPRPGAWLCHGFCALGATELRSGLADIALWMEAHPREVVMIIVQDEISFDDLSAAAEAGGLRDLAYVHHRGTPFPTLGEMIDSGRRLLIYGENLGSPDTWYQNAWDDAFTETPFTFAVRSDFSCRPNRGRPENPLFLMNHWLTTGLPVEESAAVVNSREVLIQRVDECLRERGRRPTVIATDFVEVGDLISVVDELNGFDVGS